MVARKIDARPKCVRCGRPWVPPEGFDAVTLPCERCEDAQKIEGLTRRLGVLQADAEKMVAANQELELRAEKAEADLSVTMEKLARLEEDYERSQKDVAHYMEAFDRAREARYPLLRWRRALAAFARELRGDR